jgi:hypothetical protein
MSELFAPFSTDGKSGLLFAGFMFNYKILGQLFFCLFITKRLAFMGVIIG